MKITYEKAVITEKNGQFITEEGLKVKKLTEAVKGKLELENYFSYVACNKPIAKITFYFPNEAKVIYKTPENLMVDILNEDKFKEFSNKEWQEMLESMKSVINFSDIKEIVRVAQTFDTEDTLKQKIIECIDKKKELKMFAYNCKVKQYFTNEKNFLFNGQYNQYPIVSEAELENLNLPMILQLTTIYELESYVDFFKFLFMDLLERNSFVKLCTNCERFFSPKHRSNTIYCDNTSPQNKNKTCQQYAKKATYQDNLKANEDMSLYKKIYMQRQDFAKRYSDSEEHLNNFEKFKRESKEWKLKVKNGTKTKDEYIKWLKSLRGEK